MESQTLGTIMNKKENLAEFFVMLVFIGRSWPLFGGSVFADMVICRFLFYCALWMHDGNVNCAGPSSSSRAGRLALLCAVLIDCFNLLTQETLLHIVFLHPSVWKGTDKVLMVMLYGGIALYPWGGIATLSVASYYWDPDEIGLGILHWHQYDFTTNLILRVLSLPPSRKYPCCSRSRVNVDKS